MLIYHCFIIFFFKSVTFLSAFLAWGFSLVSKHSSLQLIYSRYVLVMPGLLWVVILLPSCCVTLHLQFIKSGLLLQYHSCPMHMQQPVSYFRVKCCREWKKLPIWLVHCGNPTLHTIGHIHDFESGIFRATCQWLVAWD